MQYLPNATIVGFSSRFDWKILRHWKHAITKPLHYGIQIGTGSNLHHVGIMCDGLLYEALGSTGVRKIFLESKLEEIDDCVDVIIFKPTNKLTPTKLTEFRIDLENQVGKQYSTSEAFLSVLTKILAFGLKKSKPKNKKTFCSKLVFYAYQNIHPATLEGILPRTINPEECKKVLRVPNLIKEGEILRCGF